MKKLKDLQISDPWIWSLMALGLVLLLFSMPRKGSDSRTDLDMERRLEIEAKVRERINQGVSAHLQGIERKKASREWQVEQANRDLAPSLGQFLGASQESPGTLPPHLANLPPDRSSEKVYRDISTDRSYADSHLADRRIDSQLAHRQWMEEYEALYEAEYIKAFLANARAQGYEIRLNDDLEVVDIRRIRRPEPMRFPQSEERSGSARESFGGAIK